MTKSQQNSVYSTSDFYLSITLVTLGFPVGTIELINGKAIFTFANDKELNQIVDSYWKQEARVEPQVLFQSYKLLKNRLNSLKRDED